VLGILFVKKFYVLYGIVMENIERDYGW